MPTRIIAIANQKGGVGKSTTAVSLGAALSELGYLVLVLDLDPQGNASTGLGIRHEARAVTVYDVLASEAAIDQAIVATPVERLFAIPSTIDLAGAEIELVSQFSRELRLRKALDPLRDGKFDFVLLDCPPSLGLLTVNALAAAQELIVPIQCEYYALEGLGQLLRNVRLVQQNVNPRLSLTGIVLTMFDSRTKLAEQVVDEVRRYFGDRVYDTVIPRTVRLSEAPGFGQPITVYDPKSRGAECYRALSREVAGKRPTGEPLPGFEDLPDVLPPPREPPDLTPVPAPRVRVENRVTEPSDPPPEVLGEVPSLETVDSQGASTITEVEAAPSASDRVFEFELTTASETLVEDEGSDPEPEIVPWPAAEPEASGVAPTRVPDAETEEPAVVVPEASASGREREPQKRRWRLFGKGGDR